jgi:hypothetical protein
MTVPKTRITEQLARSAANAKARSLANLKPLKPGHGNTFFVRPVTSRNRLQNKFLSALADDFEMHGKRAIERARIQDPMGYVKAVVALMPKQFEQTTPLQDLTDQELERGIEFLKSKLAISDGKGDRAPPLIEQTNGVSTVPKTD